MVLRWQRRGRVGRCLSLNKNDVIRVVTGNGGGLGNPKSRNKALIKEDLKNELITPEVAKTVYGMSEA